MAESRSITSEQHVIMSGKLIEMLGAASQTGVAAKRRSFVAVLLVCFSSLLVSQACSGGSDSDRHGNDNPSVTVVSPRDGSKIAPSLTASPGSESQTSGVGVVATSGPDSAGNSSPDSTGTADGSGNSSGSLPQPPPDIPWPLPAPDQPPPDPRIFINGLKATDVTSLLEGRGFTCSSGNQVQPQKGWACQYTSPDNVFNYYVAVHGKEPAQIYAVYALFYSNTPAGSFPLAADFLGSIASIPYDDGDPVAAKAWIEENIRSDVQRTFGSGAFSMYGPSYVKVLEIKAVSPS